MYGSHTNGLRLIDDDGNLIVDETWDSFWNEGRWETRMIPTGQEIFGLQCLTSEIWQTI